MLPTRPLHSDATFSPVSEIPKERLPSMQLPVAPEPMLTLFDFSFAQPFV